MKGNVMLESLVVSVFLLILAISVFLGDKILTEIKTATANTTADGKALLNQTYYTKGLDALSVFDVGFVVVLVFSFLATILSAFYIRTHPAFFVVSLIVLIVSTFVTVQISNVFNEFSIASDMVSTANRYPILVSIMQNLPFYMGIFGFVLLIVIFSKVRDQSGV